MQKLTLWIVASMALSGSMTYAQDFAGTWQGTLRSDKDLRIVLKISKVATGGWKVVYYSIDQSWVGLIADGATLDRTILKFTITQMDASYEGKLNANGSTITGTWAQGSKLLPFTLTRPNVDAAWQIPKPPAPMEPGVSPAFEVATVKACNPDFPGYGVGVHGRRFTTRNLTLDELIEFAYGVQNSQIVSGPTWMAKDKFDISGEPDHEGQPNDQQWKTMVQKLMADRFRLTFHHARKDLPVYMLSVGKNGPALTKNDHGGPLPGLGFRPIPRGVIFEARNATMADFASSMQTDVLDRPIVDETGLIGRFDFHFSWAPDDSQFTRHPLRAQPGGQPAPENPLPSLFTAIQEQLGLKLEAAKARCDVLVIDHVEKPSAN